MPKLVAIKTSLSGRPPGVKEKRRRQRRKRKAVPAEQKFLTVDEAADDVGLGRSAIYQNLEEIGSLKIGGRRLIVRTRLHEWILSKISPPVTSTGKDAASVATAP